MRPHPRIRKTVKWGGLALAIIFVGFVPLSCFFCTTFVFSGGAGVRMVGGRVDVVWPRPYPQPPRHWDFVRNDAPMSWRFDTWLEHHQTHTYIPVWWIAAPLIALTALAWRLDTLARRRERANLCPTCHYPATGLAPNTPCPECGARGARRHAKVLKEK